MAETETATPLSVPRCWREEALFVRRMMAHGKAKIPAEHFTSIVAKRVACWLIYVFDQYLGLTKEKRTVETYASGARTSEV